MVKKTGSKDFKIPKPKKKPMTKAELEETLLNNFINLQKVLTNLSIKFEDLSTNMSKILQLFEISAKSFAEKLPEKTEIHKGDKQLLDKLDTLLNQNKTIAQGILLMENKIKHRNTPTQQDTEQKFHKPRPLPKI